MSWSAGVSFDPPGTVQSPQQTSPTSETPGDFDTSRKRKRSSITSTPNGDVDSNGSPTTKARHQPGVKRACNDCRQQKVRYSQYPPSSTFNRIKNSTNSTSSHN